MKDPGTDWPPKAATMNTDAIERLREEAARIAGYEMTNLDVDDARAILDHIAALTAERDAAVAEVAQIVAWLRDYSQGWNGVAGTAIRCAADPIAAGAHKENKHETK